MPLISQTTSFIPLNHTQETGNRKQVSPGILRIPTSSKTLKFEAVCLSVLEENSEKAEKVLRKELRYLRWINQLYPFNPFFTRYFGCKANCIYVENGGMNLERYLNFTPSDCIAGRLFVDIVHGLHLLHKEGIVHRDLKPTNILVSLDVRAKLCDFDLTCHESCFNINSVCGTYNYMAPEMVSCYRINIKELPLMYARRPTDIFSLGLIYLEIYRKKMPSWFYFSKNNQKEIEDKYSRMIAKPASDPYGMLATDQFKRPTAADLVKHVGPLELNEDIHLHPLAIKAAQVDEAAQGSLPSNSVRLHNFKKALLKKAEELTSELEAIDRIGLLEKIAESRSRFEQNADNGIQTEATEKKDDAQTEDEAKLQLVLDAIKVDLAAALQTANTIEDKKCRGKALLAIAKKQDYDAALLTVDSIEDEESKNFGRIWNRINLSKFTLKKATKNISKIAPRQYRIFARVEIVNQLAKNSLSDALDFIAEFNLDEDVPSIYDALVESHENMEMALKSVGEIADDSERDRFIAAIVKKYTSSAFEDSLKAAYCIKDSKLQGKTLITLTGYAAAANLPKAISICAAMDDAFYLAASLINLADKVTFQSLSAIHQDKVLLDWIDSIDCPFITK